MIKQGDLRKNNLVRTEFGICRVAYAIWNDVYVYGKDNRVNYVREVEGLGIGEVDFSDIDKDLIREVLHVWLFIHELQNWYYWKTGKELELNYE